MLVHPGGPFWHRKDLGAWSIPKGEVGDGEDLLTAAKREFHEETGFVADGPALPLGHVRQVNRKIVHAWAMAFDVDPSRVRSNTFEIEWPRGSGRLSSFPEVDRAEWFGVDEAHRRIVPAQGALLDRLALYLRDAGPA